MFEIIHKKKRTGEKGQALVLVLVLLTLASLVIPALLGFIGTGAKTGRVYDIKATELYAADAGIQDAVWQVKYEHTKNDAVKFPAYSRYDYETEWAYQISSVNNMPVDVTVQNMWIPTNIPQPLKTSTEAKDIAEGGQLIVTGTMIQTGLFGDLGEAISQYRIKISYYPEAGWILPVDSIGVWLPRGFTYFSDTNHKSSFEDVILFPETENQSIPVVQPWAGNEAALWTFGTPTFESFVPDQTVLPLVLDVTFYFKPPENQTGQKPDAVAWIKTSGGDIPYSWDASFIVSKFTSTAGSTEIESYNTKADLQKLASAVNGDYWATGNTLMYNRVPDSGHIRDTWLNASDHSSSATVPLETNPGDGDGIPVDGDVAAAFLYWTSWYKESSKVAVSPLNPDTCSNFNNWNAGSAWTISSNTFRANYSGGSASSRVLALQTPINMSAYSTASGAKVTVSWDQWVISGAGNQTRVPTADGNKSGTWNTTLTQTQTRVPTGDENETGSWTTNPCWDDVDETSADDSNYMIGVSNGHQTFSFSPFTIPAGSTITNLKIYYRAGNTASNAANIRASLKVNGNYYDSTDAGNDPPDNPNWTTFSYTYTTNPATSSAWTVDEINGVSTATELQAFGCSSTDLNPDVKVSMVYAEVTYTSAIGTNLYASVDETTANDSDYIIGTTDSGGHMLFDFSPFTIPAGSTITNLKIYYRAGNTASNAANIRASLKVNGNYYDSTDAGNDPPNSPNWTTFSYTYTTNPATSSAWTVDEINGVSTATELQGFGCSSTDLNPDVNVSMVYAEVNYSAPISSSDGLDYFISYNGGETANIAAFRGNIGSTAVQYAYDIPSQYINDQFTITFALVDFNEPGQYCNIDNIKITVMVPDNQVYFNIDGTRVHFDTDIDGNPIPKNDDGTAQITADRVQVIRNITSGVSMGFSYASYKDVTALVRAFSTKAPDPAINFPGAAIYTVGNVDGTLGIDGGDYQLAHAGWSLIIIYEGPTTLGHQLYLYDNFTYADDYSDLVFDGDDSKLGSTISGFIVPEKIPAETIAAKLTVFVGEGDDWINTEDFIAFNAPDSYWENPATSQPENIPNSYKLWDGMASVDRPGSNTSASPNNVWNGLSTVTSADGIDVDTFSIPWSSGMLTPGDTSAHVDIYTGQDNWNMVYIIISFRSSVTTGGSLLYLIKKN